MKDLLYPRVVRDRKNGGYFVRYNKFRRSDVTYESKKSAIAEMNGDNVLWLGEYT